MADDKGSSHAPSGWQVILLVIGVAALAGYAWYKHSQDPNWNPYTNMLPVASTSPQTIFP